MSTFVILLKKLCVLLVNLSEICIYFPKFFDQAPFRIDDFGYLECQNAETILCLLDIIAWELNPLHDLVECLK